MSAVEQFDSILKELPTLKAPGVSGTRIKNLTDLAVKNVSEESNLITTLYSACKATPSSHKLGALYVVDSVVRVYMDEAKKRGETVDSLAPQGTFAAGVYKIGELVESLIDDAMELLINASTNVKIGKLVDIWERAQTFSPEKIANIRKKHFTSTTPPNSPPGKKAALPPPPTSAKTNDSGSILLALASLAKTTPTPPTDSPTPLQAAPAKDNATNILSQLSALAGNSANPVNLPPAQNVQPSQPGQPNKEYIFSMLQQMQGGQQQGQGPNGQPNHMPSMPNLPNVPNMPNMSNLPNMPNMPSIPNIPNQQQMPGMPQMQQGPPMGMQNGGYNQNSNSYGRGREEYGGYSRRNRSRSPPRGRFDGGNNGGFERPGFDRGGHEPQGGADPHSKSLSHGFSPAEGEQNVPGAPHYRPRNVGFDNTMPQGSFKVMSRTLFIGGVPRGMDERQLASHLRPYAEVQSVILNSERRHAFVKVYSRKEAEQVVASFNKDGALPLRTRWGVGFGPRDCCNYQHGISIIPIQRLTDADRAWVVQAQWGGTGGQPLVSGIVIDEPDIEIGTGISSKAMSKKMPTNSARNGPKSNRPGELDEQFARTSQMGGQQEYMSYALGNNPLTGLFNNQPAQQGYQQMPPQGGYPQQAYGQPNGNLSAQLADFFQNGQQR